MSGNGATSQTGAREGDASNPNRESLQHEDTNQPTSGGLATVVSGHVFDLTTRHRFELINLTQRVEELVAKTGIRQGFALLQSLHSTAALFVNEWQEALLVDFRTLLEQT